MRDFTDKVKEAVTARVVTPVVESYDVSKTAKKRVERQVQHEIEKKFTTLQDDFLRDKRVAEVEYEKSRQTAVTEAELKAADDSFQQTMASIQNTFQTAVQTTIQETIQNKPREVVEQMEKQKAADEKRSVEESVRDHLRGFSRTIPSFIMAYGDKNLKLANFDDYTEPDVFQEVTGITQDDFRFLRDGGNYEDPTTGETQHFAGHLFDETVFNDSVLEFLRKRDELADYFGDAHKEDIFDYIPPQKTNQVFTPRWVVKKMVDALEAENPGCFDNPNATFADLYMKSGLYIAEIVKRLFHSETIKAAYPDDKDRIRHILEQQVYGMAPTRIIYLIATKYILGFDDDLAYETRNFVEADSAEAAKNGMLDELVNRYFGRGRA